MHAPDLYLAGPDALLATIRGFDAASDAVLVVGHNDGLEIFAGELSGTDVRLKTSSYAVLTSSLRWHDWAPGSAELRDVVVAR